MFAQSLPNDTERLSWRSHGALMARVRHDVMRTLKALHGAPQRTASRRSHGAHDGAITRDGRKGIRWQF